MVIYKSYSQWLFGHLELGTLLGLLTCVCVCVCAGHNLNNSFLFIVNNLNLRDTELLHMHQGSLLKNVKGTIFSVLIKQKYTNHTVYVVYISCNVLA